MVRIRLSPRSMKRYSHVKRRQSIRVKQTIRCNLDHFAFPLLPRPTTASQDAAAMAKTKVSQLPQPPHDRFTALPRARNPPREGHPLHEEVFAHHLQSVHRGVV
jgi:hypothetical protein